MTVEYRDRLKNMGLISSVEQFFEYYVYLKRPSEMAREIDLYFFREGEVPMWEVRLPSFNGFCRSLSLEDFGF